MIGVLKAFLGLSGSFFTTVYVSFLDPDAVAFLLMLALVPCAVVLACTPFINYVPYIQVEPHTKVSPCPASKGGTGRTAHQGEVTGLRCPTACRPSAGLVLLSMVLRCQCEVSAVCCPSLHVLAMHMHVCHPLMTPRCWSAHGERVEAPSNSSCLIY